MANADLYTKQLAEGETKKEGDRRQETGDRRQNVNYDPLSPVS
jgi:hypothetical protein